MLSFIGTHFVELVLTAGTLFMGTLLWVSIDDARRDAA